MQVLTRTQLYTGRGHTHTHTRVVFPGTAAAGAWTTHCWRRAKNARKLAPKNGVASSGEIFPSSSLSSLSLTVHTHARKRGCFPGQILPPAGQGYPEYLRHRIASSCGNYDFIKLDPKERNKNRKWLATRLLSLRGSLFTHELASGSGTRSPERSPYVQPNNSQESSSKLLQHEKPLNRYTFYTKLFLLLLKNPATQLPVPAVGTEPATIPGRSLTHAHEMI